MAAQSRSCQDGPMQIKRSLIGTFGYLALVSCAYGIARGMAALTGWATPAGLVTMTLAAFFLLIVIASHVYARMKRPELEQAMDNSPDPRRSEGDTT
jgi:hypothetical protein